MRPSAWWFGVAGAVAAAGIAVAIVLFVRTYTNWVDRIENFDRVDVPGEGTVTLDGTGGYTIYHEYPGANETFFGPNVFDIALTAPNGSNVELRDYTSSVTYANGSEEGRALFSFTADEPGDYVLSADGDFSTLAVGRGVGRGVVSGIAGGVAAGFVGVLAGIVIAVVVAVRRGRERRRQRGFVPPPPGAGMPYGTYGAAGMPGPPGFGWGPSGVQDAPPVQDAPAPGVSAPPAPPPPAPPPGTWPPPAPPTDPPS